MNTEAKTYRYVEFKNKEMAESRTWWLQTYSREHAAQMLEARGVKPPYYKRKQHATCTRRDQRSWAPGTVVRENWERSLLW